MSYEAADQYEGSIYRDPVVERGRAILELLDEVRDTDQAQDGVISVTRIEKWPDSRRAYYETTTIHEAKVLGDIHPGLLKQDAPPVYMLGLLGNLVVAHIAHENQKRIRNVPLFSPDKTELADHVSLLWATIPAQVHGTTETGSYDLPIHTIGKTTLMLHRPEGALAWSLSFRRSEQFMLFVNLHVSDDEVVEEQAS